MVLADEGDNSLWQATTLRLYWEQRRYILGAETFIYDLVVGIPEVNADRMPTTIVEWLALSNDDFALVWLESILFEGHGLSSFHFVFYDSNIDDRRRGYPPRVSDPSYLDEWSV